MKSKKKKETEEPTNEWGTLKNAKPIKEIRKISKKFKEDFADKIVNARYNNT
ncbi:hypothetical protein ES703_96860 [subsurface metagenome]